MPRHQKTTVRNVKTAVHSHATNLCLGRTFPRRYSSTLRCGETGPKRASRILKSDRTIGASDSPILLRSYPSERKADTGRRGSIFLAEKPPASRRGTC